DPSFLPSRTFPLPLPFEIPHAGGDGDIALSGALRRPTPDLPPPPRRVLPLPLLLQPPAAEAAADRRRRRRLRRTPRRLLCKAADHVGDVEEQTWDEVVLGCETAVLVAFWAPWCGPCRLMHPIIADLAKAYAGRLRCLRVNTDENQEVASRYGIRSIPTILIFKDGERKETVIGAIADTALAATVDRFL
uniref:Thioredoxin domain-containing protein n=1 Tax=Aegilops tauschii subsp. strangulata TaxID=200361 RepID=A0A453TDD5_AEGTS